MFPMSRENRIIPARAGFTTCHSPSRSLSRDHPRSRGVYLWSRSSRPPPSGSSPLARGLRPVICDAGSRPRIIPARAGFTSGSMPIIHAAKDHPRSRGVYPSQRRGRENLAGSSPLARGLPVLRVIGQDQVGIIPARAGFTGGLGRGCRFPAGSSPLARGLQMNVTTKTNSNGIIPARAGFTNANHKETQNTEDHPRSRGVYLY